jgi:hypothetical protein
MSAPPERIWVCPNPEQWECETGDWMAEFWGHPTETPYILATPAALADTPEVAAIVAEAVAKETERLREVCGEARLILDTGFRQLGETVDYAPHVIEGVCNMLEHAAALRTGETG